MIRVEFLVDGDRTPGSMNAPHVGAKDFEDGKPRSEALAEFAAEVLSNVGTRALLDEGHGIRFATRSVVG